MVIIVKGSIHDRGVEDLLKWIEAKNIKVMVQEGVQKTIFGLIGDTTALDIDAIKSFSAVEDVKRTEQKSNI